MSRRSFGAALAGAAAMSLRTRLILVFVALSIAATALFGSMAYSASRDTLRRVALQSVEVAAQERTEAFRSRIEARIDRAAAFLGAAPAACSRGGSGGSADPCLQALERYRAIEGFSAALLTRPGSPPLLLGPRAAALGDVPAYPPGQIVRFGRDASDRPYYVVRARSPVGTALTLRFDDLRSLRDIFDETVGLGRSGETFLADERGYFITPPRHPVPAGASHPVTAEPMLLCLAGRNAAMLAPDYRRADVVHAFRSVDFMGGGCVMAHIEQAEAFAPSRTLGRRMVGLGMGLMVVFVLASVLLARSLSQPILRLATAAREIEGGDLDREIRAGGPGEIRALGGALTSMVSSLRQRTEALEEANQAKGAFLAAMSHELRTPLNAIGGYIDLMELGVYGENSPEQLRALDRVRHSQRSLLVLINDILQHARIEAGKLEFEIREVSVAHLLDGLEAVVDPQVRAAGLAYSVEPYPADLSVQADPERAQQILLNLLTNAVKFTPSGGRIRLSNGVRGRYVEIRVHDTGRGIPPEMMKRIFDPFVQVRNAGEGDPSRQGVGLGLAISRDLARGMGGDLAVESALGHGSTFTLTLPAPLRRKAEREAPG